MVDVISFNGCVLSIDGVVIHEIIGISISSLSEGGIIGTE